jgi:heme-degrading monooxygenase HmoA
MLVRLWHGATPIAKSDAYLELMRSIAIPDYQQTPGNLAAYVLHAVDGDIAHFQMLTFWEDIESMKAFAGNDYRAAKYYDFDPEFLIELEPTATVYQAYDK